MTPSAPSGIAPPRRRMSRRTQFLRRIVLANVFVFTFSACGLAYGYWFEQKEVDATQRIDLLLEHVTGGKPVNFLIIGSDSRAFVKTKQQAQQFGSASTEGGQRSDTMMIVRLDPKSRQTLVVSIPRDLWVTIPHHGQSKINAAFNYGAQTVIDTLKANFGIQINHYLEVDFAGFRNIVNAIGTVQLFFPTIARDTYTGLFVQHPGCVALTGDQALAYVRSRHYQYKIDYRSPQWLDDPTGDLGRIRRQQYFLRSLAHEAIDSALHNPLGITHLVDQMFKPLTADRQLGVSDVNALITAFQNTDPGAVEMATIPTDPGWDSTHTQAILTVRAHDAAPLLARLRGELPSAASAGGPSIAPSRVQVRVLNGSGISGAARRLLDALTAVGFRSGGAANADRSDVVQTEVHVNPASTAVGRLVAGYLDSAARVVDDASVATGTVEVVVGTDQPTVHAPAGTSTTGATAASSTTLPPNPGHTPGVTVPATEAGRPLVGCG